MWRAMDAELLRWKDSSPRKPLVIRGARQVGKTFTVQRFGRAHFGAVVTVDLERDPRARRVFEGDLGARKLLGDLEVLTGCRIEPGRTLLFLDEIQACPRAMTALRYLYEECPKLAVVVAGSLLEFALEGTSFPVGRVRMLDLRPMTFLEFARAVGNDPAADALGPPPRPLPPATHETLLDLVRSYCFVGGMPEVVAEYARHRSLPRCAEVLDSLRDTIRQDFPRYAARANRECLEAILERAPRFVGEQVKYVRLSEHHPGPVVKRALDLLTKARILTEVRAANPGDLPLGMGVTARRFKLICLDVGLWQNLCGLRLDREFAERDLLDVHRGAMAEQFVGQELLAAGGGGLHYWSREAPGSQAEVDYLAEIRGELHGVEVKSGAAGRLRALHRLLADHPNVRGGLVFSSRPWSGMPDRRLAFLPLYHAYAAVRSP